jgi:hypothetical protein
VVFELPALSVGTLRRVNREPEVSIVEEESEISTVEEDSEISSLKSQIWNLKSGI